MPTGRIKTEIEGPAVLSLPSGGTLALECTVSRLMLPPKKLQWKHRYTVLTPKERPGLSLESEKLAGVSHTKLVIVDLKPSDEGRYHCVADELRPASIRLFIGERMLILCITLFYFGVCHSMSILSNKNSTPVKLPSKHSIKHCCVKKNVAF